MKNTDHVVKVVLQRVEYRPHGTGRYFNVLNIDHVVQVDTSTC